MIYVHDKNFIKLTKFGKSSKKVRIPNPIGQIIICFDKIIPITKGIAFLKPNCYPAFNKIIFAGPGVATIETANKSKPTE